MRAVRCGGELGTDRHTPRGPFFSSALPSSPNLHKPTTLPSYSKRFANRLFRKRHLLLTSRYRWHFLNKRLAKGLV
jgi:hypothetical protein